MLIGNGGSDLFATNHTDDTVFFCQTKADHRHIVIHSQCHCGHICGLQTLLQNLGIGQGIELHCSGVLMGIGRIDTVDILGHQDSISLDLHAAKHCTGIGVSISANKVDGIRCALLSDVWSAKMTRLHNDTNMMALGAGIVGENLALEIVDTWLGTEFSGDERHQRRIDKLMALEK